MVTANQISAIKKLLPKCVIDLATDYSVYESWPVWQLTIDTNDEFGIMTQVIRIRNQHTPMQEAINILMGPQGWPEDTGIYIFDYYQNLKHIKKQFADQLAYLKSASKNNRVIM